MMFRKRLIRILFGLSGLLLIHGTLVYLYLVPYLQSQWRYQNYALFDALAEETEILLLGDSHVRVNIMPLMLGDAYSLASPGQTYIEDYYLLRNVLEEQARPIRLVILPLDLHSFDESRVKRSAGTPYWLNHLNYFEVGRETGEDAYFAARYLNKQFFPYAGMLNFYSKLLRPDQLFKGFTGHTNAGFRLYPIRPTSAPVDRRVARKTIQVHFPGGKQFDPRMGDYLGRMIDLCRENKVAVVLVKTPLTRIYWEEAGAWISIESWADDVDRLLEKHPPTAVLDYRLAYADQPQYFRNTDHLNSIGAELLTAEISRDLLELGLLTDDQVP